MLSNHIFATIITPVLCFFCRRGFQKPCHGQWSIRVLIPVWLPSDSRYVASAGKDRDVRLWSVQGTRSRCIGQLSGHTAYVTAIAFTHTTAQGTPALALGCVPGEVTLSLVGIGGGGLLSRRTSNYATFARYCLWFPTQKGGVQRQSPINLSVCCACPFQPIIGNLLLQFAVSCCPC